MFTTDDKGGVHYTDERRTKLIGYSPASKNDRNPYSTDGLRDSWERGYKGQPELILTHPEPFERGQLYRRWEGQQS